MPARVDREPQRVKNTSLKFQRRDGSTGEIGQRFEEEESDGTRALFAFAGPWLDVMKHSRVLVVDELDSSLHPLVVRHLVSLLLHADSRGAVALHRAYHVAESKAASPRPGVVCGKE